MDNPCDGEKGSSGYMEMLVVQDYGSNSLFDLLQMPTVPSPVTPNYSSISSSSNEAPTDDQQQCKRVEDQDEHDHEEKTKKQ